MNCLRMVEQKMGNIQSLQLEPHTTIAVQDATLLVVNCSALTVFISKVLVDCIKYAPRYVPLIKPIVIGLFICIIYDAYTWAREIITDWKSEEDQLARIKKLDFLVMKTKITQDEKSKRRNHRGGVKAKKAKGKGGSTGTATIKEV